MAKSSTYSNKDVAVTLDGVLVRGFWDGDDAVVVAPGADIGTGLVGADGSSIFSQSADESAMITLRLQHTSATHRQLMQKLARQRASSLDGFPVVIIDSRSGEGESCDQAFIQTAPDDSKGKNAVVREWVLWTGSLTREIPNG